MSDTCTNSIHDKIAKKLTAYFAPEKLEIINESAHHQGHSGHYGGVKAETGETHFCVIITAAHFAGMSRPERHRAVYQVLAEELRGGVHALALTIKAPGE
ncbi:BolA family protein [Candidatus Tokpelaia sp.]|uniref:BolA family protein n=1 Tax=Candidatus Tokpelaia sp. TaxID=2233777 RepID=UPI00123A5547|nr:BolA family protein [Candidatus Tokpelaia sp.]KAA6406230.1 BolA family transcriptional regulator [Candidatus Tokpelaia sp.]